MAVAARDAAHFLGMPEANTALAQAGVYLATAPKSKIVYLAYRRAAEAASRDLAEPLPLHLCNAPTRLMKEAGYGAGYRYLHDDPKAAEEMTCLPPSLLGRRYLPPPRGGK